MNAECTLKGPPSIGGKRLICYDGAHSQDHLEKQRSLRQSFNPRRPSEKYSFKKKYKNRFLNVLMNIFNLKRHINLQGSPEYEFHRYLLRASGQHENK